MRHHGMAAFGVQLLLKDCELPASASKQCSKHHQRTHTAIMPICSAATVQLTWA
jgi:hypothetical protein